MRIMIRVRVKMGMGMKIMITLGMKWKLGKKKTGLSRGKAFLLVDLESCHSLRLSLDWSKQSVR
jgi:hypothetical protein